MAYTRKQVVTTLSVVWLILVTALSGYASSNTKKLSLPIPNGLSYATTLLPIVSGLLLELGYDFTRSRERRTRLARSETARSETPRPPLVIVANTIIFIYSTVVITLLGTHAAPPSGLDCGLRERWTDLYRHKDVESVRAIQDAFNCCGLKNSRDMAWPFPDRSHNATACEQAFGRTQGCMGLWKAEEQHMAGIFMTAVGLVFLWQFAIIVIPTQRESWLHRIAPDSLSRMLADEGNQNEGNDGPRRAIDYLPNFNHYADRIEEEASDGEVENGTHRAIKAGTEQAENVFQGRSEGETGERDPPENEWLRSG